MKSALGIVFAIIGMGMVLSLQFTPKFIWDWFAPCSLGNCQNQPTTVYGNFENELAHGYLYMMFFGGWFVFVRGIFWAIPQRKNDS